MALNTENFNTNSDNQDLPIFMDAAKDKIEDGMTEEELEISFVRSMVEECQGETEEGDPLAAITLSLDMISTKTQVQRSVFQQSMYDPVVTINRRVNYIELILTFPNAADTNLKLLSINMDKYGKVMDELKPNSSEYPFFSLVILPVLGLGAYYMSMNNPLFWALTTEKLGAEINQMKMLFHCDDVEFYETDEIDISEIQAAIQREQEAREAAIAAMEEKEEQRKQREQELEELRQALEDEQ